MPLTRQFKETVVERIQREPDFAKRLITEAGALLFSGESATARLMLRDLVNATMGFEKLGADLDVSPKSLHRMLSANGNPGMNSLSLILSALCSCLNVDPFGRETRPSVGRRRRATVVVGQPKTPKRKPSEKNLVTNEPASKKRSTKKPSTNTKTTQKKSVIKPKKVSA